MQTVVECVSCGSRQLKAPFTGGRLVMEPETLEVTGRHDPCIVLRAVPVVEAAMAIGLLDLLMEKPGL